MDERTVEVYERSAAEYGQKRRPGRVDRAEAFAAAVPTGTVRLDLGTGPGHHLPHLGRPAVAADAAVAMVTGAAARHPDVPGVACDLEALPFARGALGGVWASKCLQHVPTDRLPMALAGIHRALRPGGVLDLTVFDRTAGPAGVHGPDGRDGPDRRTWISDDDDFPGRLFAFWAPDDLARVLVGAGFELDGPPETDPPAGGPPPVDGIRPLMARARRGRTLPDTVAAGMRLLVCGLNPSLYAADAGVGYARPGNRFWPAALAAGLVTVDRDPDHALRHHGVGMTDVVKRATVGAAELRPDEYRAGLGRVEHLVRWLRPGAICFVGLAGWRAARDRRAQPGVQPTTLGGTPVYVMPSTSGLNAHSSPADLTAHLRAAAALADGA